jgi:hypothetical protein
VVEGKRTAIVINVAGVTSASLRDYFVFGDVEGFGGAVVQERGEFALPEIGGGREMRHIKLGGANENQDS